MLCREHGGTEHVEESMHLCIHFITKLADRMMQSRGKLDRDTRLCRSDKDASYLG
jgi:hypothetical protein